MIEVDGKKYISEEEFDNKVTEELHEVSRTLANLISKNGDMMEGLLRSMVVGGAIADAYANLRTRIFGKRNKDDEER